MELSMLLADEWVWISPWNLVVPLVGPILAVIPGIVALALRLRERREDLKVAAWFAAPGPLSDSMFTVGWRITNIGDRDVRPMIVECLADGVLCCIQAGKRETKHNLMVTVNQTNTVWERSARKTYESLAPKDVFQHRSSFKAPASLPKRWRLRVTTTMNKHFDVDIAPPGSDTW